MSEVLIKGMEMPKNCAECRFCVNGFTDDAPMYECACESYENVSVLVDDHGKPFNFRPDWCQLVEVPTPHGRLIDADALKLALRKTMDACVDEDGALLYSDHLIIDADYDEVCNMIDEQPTIIEAEGSKGI